MNDLCPGPKSFTKVVGTSCKKIHIPKEIREKIHKKIQGDTFNDPVSTSYGKANSSLRPDSFLKSLVILKSLPSLRSCKNLSGWSRISRNYLPAPGRIKYYHTLALMLKGTEPYGKRNILPVRKLQTSLLRRSVFQSYAGKRYPYLALVPMKNSLCPHLKISKMILFVHFFISKLFEETNFMGLLIIKGDTFTVYLSRNQCRKHEALPWLGAISFSCRTKSCSMTNNNLRTSETLFERNSRTFFATKSFPYLLCYGRFTF